MRRLRIGLAIAALVIAVGVALVFEQQDGAPVADTTSSGDEQSSDVTPRANAVRANAKDEQSSVTDGLVEGAFAARMLRYDSNGVPRYEQVADRQVPLRPNERVEIELRPDIRIGDTPVVLRVDHGGIINDQPLKPRVQLTSSTSRFSFQAGVPRGKYTVHIQQGNNSEILEFWVGAPQVYGRPGPNRIFTGSSSTSGGGAP